MYQKLIFIFIIYVLSVTSHAESISKNDLLKIQSTLNEFKTKNIDMQLPDLKIMKQAVDDGLKSVQSVLTKIYGSKSEIKQALKDYSNSQSATQKNKAASLLAVNFLRFSNPNLEKLGDGLAKKSDFTQDEVQTMGHAFTAVMALSEVMKDYANHIPPKQIKYISQDNPKPNVPRLLLWPLGTDKSCTKEMVEQIRESIGHENFKRLGSSMMLTGAAYEGLYEPIYIKRTLEILKKDATEVAQRILAYLTSNLTPENAEQSYSGFMKYITQGEEEFVRVFGSQVTKQDARIFFQGYARKYPFCLGIINSDYSRIRKNLN